MHVIWTITKPRKLKERRTMMMIINFPVENDSILLYHHISITKVVVVSNRGDMMDVGSKRRRSITVLFFDCNAFLYVFYP